MSPATERDHPPIPTTLEQALSPEWLSAALATKYPGIEVSHVHPGPVVSRITTNARFRIECAGGVPDGLSPALCVKGYFNELGRALRFVGVPEAGFYRDLAEETGVRTLECVYAHVDVDTDDSILVTEDVVARGATFLDSLSPYSPDQTAQTLEELAKLHAKTWLRPSVETTGWLAPRLEKIARGRGVAEISSNFDGPIGARVPSAVRDTERLYRSYRAVVDRVSSARPWSVIHGDPHVSNLFLDADGRPALVDWQLAQRGPWYLDLGYHLAATLTVDDRRRTERDLVRHYLGALAAGGVDAPTEEQAWADLRYGLVHGFYLWAITQQVDPPITTALLERMGTAVDDHDAFAVVDG
ncbi:MAG: phosphotransferase [Candidatus Binatia bacterium]|nr:phosphotransferase [Candidatus Binatia bacterium]